MKKLQIADTFKQKIFKASVGLILINLLVKVLGYGEKLLLAKYFGTNYEVDSYTLVVSIVFTFFYFFREIVEPSFLRVFLEKSEENKNSEWKVFNLGLRIILIITLFICFVVFLYPNQVVTFFAPGFKGEQFTLTVSLLKISIISCVFLSVSTLTSIILNGKKHFIFPAIGDVIFKLVIILAFFIIDFKNGILGLGLALIVASIFKLGVHLLKLGKKISLKKLDIDPIDKARIFKLSLPLLLGVLFSQLSGIIDNGFASRLQEGAISSLSYAKKIIELPIVTLPYVLSVVIFPFFSELSIKKNTQKLKKVFIDVLMLLVLIFIPLTIFFALNSHGIVSLIFKRGAFDENSVLMTSKPLFVYSLGLIFFAIETILVIYFFSKANTKTPIVVGISCVILNIILTWCLIEKLGYLSIPLAYVIQKGVKCIWLLFLRKEDFEITFTREFLKKTLFVLLTITLFVMTHFSVSYFFVNKIKIEKKNIFDFIHLATSFLIPFCIYFLMLWKGKILNISKAF